MFNSFRGNKPVQLMITIRYYRQRTWHILLNRIYREERDKDKVKNWFKVFFLSLIIPYPFLKKGNTWAKKREEKLFRELSRQITKDCIGVLLYTKGNTYSRADSLKNLEIKAGRWLPNSARIKLKNLSYLFENSDYSLSIEEFKEIYLDVEDFCDSITQQLLLITHD